MPSVIGRRTRSSISPVIGAEEVSFVVSKITGIPLFKLEEEESEKLLHMEDFLHKRIVGQEEAISAVCRAIRRARAGLKEARKPNRVLHLPGTDGCRKDRVGPSLGRVPV